EGQAGSYGRLAYSPFTRSNDKQIFYIGQPRFFERLFGSITLFVHLLFFFILFSLPCINRFCKPDNRSTKRMPSRWSTSCQPYTLCSCKVTNPEFFILIDHLPDLFL